MSNQLANILRTSQRIVFFGGAGVSTESGIPDFRSEAGLYQARQEYGYPAETLLSHQFFMHHTAIFYKYYSQNLIYPQARPNAAHLSLARLEASGRLQAVVTQNIDGLHEQAGSRRVHALHGSVLKNYCMSCSAPYSLEVLLDKISAEEIPHCDQCGGIIRPQVVLYGESLDNQVVDAAVEAISTADTLIVGGTSLSVWPAAGLLQYYRGNSLVLINKTPTPYDKQANLVIHAPIGQVLHTALEAL